LSLTEIENMEKAELDMLIKAKIKAIKTRAKNEEAARRLNKELNRK